MIRIISGNYGYRVDGRVEVKTPASEPFTCDSKEEARLVELKVAEYVDEKPEEKTEGENNQKTPNVEGEKAQENEYKLEDMSIKQLKKFAELNGFEIDKKLTRKAEIISAIENCLDTQAIEEAPQITPELPQ